MGLSFGIWQQFRTVGHVVFFVRYRFFYGSPEGPLTIFAFLLFVFYFSIFWFFILPILVFVFNFCHSTALFWCDADGNNSCTSDTRDIFVRQHFSTGDGWHNLFTMPDQLFSYHWRKRRIAISSQKRSIQGRLMLRLSHILVGLKLNFTDWEPAKNAFHSNISDIYANVGKFSERCRKWETSHCK